jgi:hypothetical protein
MLAQALLKVISIKLKPDGGAYVRVSDIESGGEFQLSFDDNPEFQEGDFIKATFGLSIRQGKFGAYFPVDRFKVEKSFELNEKKAEKGVVDKPVQKL